MQENVAKQLVRDTLESSFDKERFVYLIKNILNHVDEAPFIYKGNFVFGDFTDFIRLVEHVGEYKGPDEKLIDILIVHLQNETSLERARTKQRNFVAKYLKGSRGEIFKDAALVAFVAPNGADWRFSFVKMGYRFNENGKIKEEFTPACRYSFLVGENENSHTAQSRLLPTLLKDEINPTLEVLEEIFSVERVTKEFFEKYRDLFLRLKESLDTIVKEDTKIKTDLKAKSVDTVNFAKKLLGQIVFLYFLQKKGWFGIAPGKEWGSGSKHFLRELFEKKHCDYENFFNDILEPLFYEALRRERDGDYYSRFNCRIPFLNGGLFDPLGDYNWWNTDILLSDDLFSNDCKTEEGDAGNGILDVFDRYNFTVKEDEPLEKEVAVDPEMLGKVFENLLEVKDRKSKGTYYTPREIVHYMCQESLTDYLVTELEDKTSKEDIERLIKYGEASTEYEATDIEKKSKNSNYKGGYDKSKLPKNIEKYAELIDEKLASVRICDPAVGSGAFPVGMMNEIVRARNALTAYIGKNGERLPYHFKRQAIQNCLYGVDNDPGAVEIAKLRLWLSLIVDEDDRKTIQPLPNLDYKVVQGNSLLGFPYTPLWLEEIEGLKLKFFEEIRPEKKEQLRDKINKAIMQQLANTEKSLGYKIDFDFKIFFSEVFHEKGGFDVVIANPPYLSHDKIQEKEILASIYKAYEPFADLYCYFLEIALDIQNRAGVLCYITSNSYLKADYGKPLRDLLLKRNYILSIINIENFQVFDTAIVNVAMLIAQGRNEKEPPRCLIVNAKYDGETPFEVFIEKRKFYYSQDIFEDKAWYLIHPCLLCIKKKIELVGKTLEGYGTKIRLGIATGANEVFIIDEIKKKELIKKDPRNKDIIKPILRGQDIFRYKYRFNNKYIILAANGIDIRNYYPEIYRYFDSFGDPFKKRGAKGEHWYNLRPTAFLEDFKKDMIIWIDLTDRGRFALCEEEVYLLNTALFLIPPKEFSSKYLLALLNSKLIKFYLTLIAQTSGMGTARWIKNYVKEFSIPEASSNNQKPFIDLANRILAITKDDDYLENPAKQAKVRFYEEQINQFVYRLYDLTDEEIKIVENYGG